jgi:hypothetical protein
MGSAAGECQTAPREKLIHISAPLKRACYLRFIGRDQLDKLPTESLRSRHAAEAVSWLIIVSSCSRAAT